MRIVHVDPERSFSGGEVQLFLLMEGLRARGHHNVLAAVPGGAPERAARERGFEARAVRMRSDLDLAAVARLKRVIVEARADVVHLHTGRATWLGGLAARLAGRPAVTTRRMDRRVKRNWRTRVIYGALVERAAAISPAVLARLVEGGVPRDRIELIWSSVDPEALAPARPAAEVRAELGAPPDAPVALSAGALVRRKGFDVLLDAFARVADETGAHLWIAGDGPERDALAERLPPRARLLGRRDDVPALLAACDVFVMPSRAEGLGVAALEAMAVGRPVVASRVGGLGELVVDGRTGSLVPPDDPAALAGALGPLLADPALRERYGRAGEARVAEGFLPERMVDAYEELYRAVLLERGAA